MSAIPGLPNETGVVHLLSSGSGKAPKPGTDGRKEVLYPTSPPEQNYGIDLHCGKYIVVDVDYPEHIDKELPPTWHQKTKKGYHYLYKAPEGLKLENTIWFSEKGYKVGEILTKNHIVGPGSTINGHTYTYLGGEPQNAPAWVTEKIRNRRIKQSVVELSSENGTLAKYPQGDQDNYLCSIAGGLFNRNLSNEAIAKILYGMTLAFEQNPEDPFTYEGLLRKTHTWRASWVQVTRPELLLTPEMWEDGTTIQTWFPPAKWWIHQFIPASELVLMFGGTGIGKSSFVSYLASLVLKKGKTFGISISEESVGKFLARTAHSSREEITPHLTRFIDIKEGWVFPRDLQRLDDALEKHPLDFLYLDSIKSNLDLNANGNDPNLAARACLAPLVSLARKHEVTIFGTFHTTKDGFTMNAPQEFANIPRIVIQAENQGELLLDIFKTSFTRPEHKLAFETKMVEAQSIEGEPWVEYDENENLLPVKMLVITNHKKFSSGDSVLAQEVEEQIIELTQTINPETNKKYTLEQIEKKLGLKYHVIQRVTSAYKKAQKLNALKL